MYFFVVVFEKYCAAVPASWLDIGKKVIYWPPESIEFLHKDMEHMEPDELWISYTMKKMVGPFDSVKEALIAEKDCGDIYSKEGSNAIVSKLQITDTENENKFLCIPRQSAEDLSIKKSEETTSSKDDSPLTISNTNTPLNLSNIVAPTVTVNETNTLPQQFVSSQMISQQVDHFREYLSVIKDMSNVNQINHSPIIDLLTHEDNVKNCGTISGIEINNIFQVVVQSYQLLYDEISTCNKEIQELKKRKAENEAKNNKIIKLPDFPLKTMQEYEEFESSLLKRKSLRKKFCELMRRLGGNSPTHHVNHIIKVFMTLSLATQFSWSGQRNTKIKFKDGIISKLIINTVSRASNCTEVQVASKIKVWLQHAKEKLELKSKTLDKK